MQKTPMREFLSTPSARRATEDVRVSRQRRSISIHALREEGDPSIGVTQGFFVKISIHALREEGDLDAIYHALHDKEISIHALREEGDHDHDRM